jgi:hypothetical protein
MRWAELVADCRDKGLTPPTYRQMDGWSTKGLIKFENRLGHPGGQFRWWPPEEIGVAVAVARLVRVGLDVDLAFQVARTKPDKFGCRRLILDGGSRPRIAVEIDGFQ